MVSTNWLKQTNKPLFPDVLWNRPETKQRAGKLLIVGGQAQSFKAPSMAYATALKAGAGAVKVLLPDSTQKVLGPNFPEAEFAPSSLSGSFGRQSLGQLLELATWADGVLLAGDFGKNSETAILLESFVDKCAGQITLTGDSLDYFLQAPILLQRPETLLAAEFGQLQKLGAAYGLKTPVKSSMDLVRLVELLSGWTSETKAYLLTVHQEKVVLAATGQVSSAPVKVADFVELAAYASVWWLQQPQKPFEALTTAVFECAK